MKASDYWKQAIKKLHRDIVEDGVCKIIHDRKRDQNGDVIGFENRRAVVEGQLIDCDITITVDPGDGNDWQGLSLSVFQGLARDRKGVDYAVFDGGTALKLIDYKVNRIADAQVITARELTLARLDRRRRGEPSKRGPKPAPPEKRKKEQTIVDAWREYARDYLDRHGRQAQYKDFAPRHGLAKGDLKAMVVRVQKREKAQEPARRK